MLITVYVYVAVCVEFTTCVATWKQGATEQVNESVHMHMYMCELSTCNENKAHPSPAKHTGQVISSAKWQDSYWWIGLKLQLIQHGQHPAYRAIAPAGQDAKVGQMTKHLQTGKQEHNHRKHVLLLGHCINNTTCTLLSGQWKLAFPFYILNYLFMNFQMLFCNCKQTCM